MKDNAKAADPTKFGSGTTHDQSIWDELTGLVRDHDIGVREMVEDFILYYRRVNFAKFLAHIELFKKTVDLPGCIVECGVFKGVSLLTFAKLVEVYCPGDTLKRIVGFDTFQGFTHLANQDGPPLEKRGKVPGGWDSSSFYPVLRDLIEVARKDSMIPRFSRIELVEGDVCKTVPKYVKINPGLRISLLHLDLDLYDPTLTALEQLYPLVVRGGVVIVDEYAMDAFAGESAAFDEYFKGRRPRLKKFPFISTPGGYFIKEE